MEQYKKKNRIKFNIEQIEITAFIVPVWHLKWIVVQKVQ